MKIVGLALLALVAVLGFQNCSKDLGSTKSGNSTQAAAPNPNPSPSPSPGPAPSPAPSPNPQIQPAPNNSMADVKPINGSLCPSGYGVYDMVNTTPAISTVMWTHEVCVQPYAMGGTSVIADTQMVAGSACPVGFELLLTIPVTGTDYTVPRWAVTNSICIKREAVPATSHFVTYFYFSAPGAACRAGDIANGSATFCATANNGGTCMGGVLVNLCKSIQ